MRTVYVAHPVGRLPERAGNLARALRWFHWLLREYPDTAFTMPWYPYCLGTDETETARARGLRDDLEAVRRCDEVWLVGGRVSPGMQMEADEARRVLLPVRDLTTLGAEPPK